MASPEGAEALARAFAAAAGLGPGEAGGPLGAALAGALEQARRRWPGVALEGEAFAGELGRRAAGPDAAGALASLHADDLFLAHACARGDRAALAHFEREILRPVGSFVASIDAGAAFADEVRQRLGERLFARGEGGRGAIEEYAGRGPLGAWARVAATRIALNLRRGDLRQGRRAPSVEEAVGAALELDHLKERYREPFAEALREALLGLPPHQRALLRLYHVEGLSLEAMAALYRVHLATVSRRLARAREQVAEGALRGLRERLGASASEVESLVPLVLSRLELSFERLLGDEP
ncbi:MAG TPA: sigma-70 family RNA polymerase sigma factor [Polyangiaceae bacterium]|nr:sigma-70 family RNA polymerase sigma factor [Polyangiaceae bacterium]